MLYVPPQIGLMQTVNRQEQDVRRGRARMTERMRGSCASDTSRREDPGRNASV